MADSPQQNTPRPHIGLHLKCCNVYTRIYLNANRNAFLGWCPRCAIPVRVDVVEEGGSNTRFFKAN